MTRDATANELRQLAQLIDGQPQVILAHQPCHERARIVNALNQLSRGGFVLDEQWQLIQDTLSDQQLRQNLPRELSELNFIYIAHYLYTGYLPIQVREGKPTHNKTP